MVFKDFLCLARKFVANFCGEFCFRAVIFCDNDFRCDAGLFRVIGGNRRAQSFAFKSQRRAVSGARLEFNGYAVFREVNAVFNRGGDFCCIINPSCAAVTDKAVFVQGRVVCSESYHARLHFDAAAGCFQRSAAGVVVLRGVAEQT